MITGASTSVGNSWRHFCNPIRNAAGTPAPFRVPPGRPPCVPARDVHATQHTRRMSIPHGGGAVLTKAITALLLLASSCVDGRAAASANQNTYFPGPGDEWQHRSPAEVGMRTGMLDSAIAYANRHETALSRDAGTWLRDRFAGQPHQDIVGPTKPRGGVNGMVVRHGYIVAEWGETERVDMTFSVTKSYLSTVAGLALDRGRVPGLDERVAASVSDGTFDSPHNSTITWRHLLQQTSEWEGTLWGKPDLADRRRGVDRTLQTPGTFWEYNDVRVNLLAYALLHAWRRPLPAILRENIMEPIGASATWQWHGYETSWTTVDGAKVQSVSGGGHWGGGMWTSTRDHARFGLLFLRRGRWNDRQIISQQWVSEATTPVAIQPNYGFMWWLNTDQAQFPSAPEQSFFALGAGSTNVIWIDPVHDLVVVTRWIDGAEHVNEFMRLVLEAVQ